MDKIANSLRPRNVTQPLPNNYKIYYQHKNLGEHNDISLRKTPDKLKARKY